MAISESATRSVVFLGHAKNGEFQIDGTGFFVTFQERGKNVLHLVTAKHVVVAIQSKGDDGRAWIRVNTPESSEMAYMDLEDFYFHPDDLDAKRNVDVAVTPVFLKDGWEFAAINLNDGSATKAVISEHDIGPGDQIFITGYFRYHAGKAKNIPIVRTGNISAFPSEPLDSKNGPLDAYLIEARSIGGLSGSPVFVDMQPIRVNKNNKAQYYSGVRHYFLGMMLGHYDENKKDLVQSTVKIEGINIGIGIVTPVEDILETMANPDLIARRQELMDKFENRGKNVVEDSAVDNDEDGAEGDQILETMLNTPPNPNKD